MADYYIKRFPDDLLHRFKVRCAQEGLTMKAALIRLITEWVNSPFENRLDTREGE